MSKMKLAVDAVVFGYSNELNVLLVERKYEPFKGGVCLPGGFVLEAESLDEAVQRELREETGLELNYLEQLYTFGSPDRDARERTVSVAYYGLVDRTKVKPMAGTDAEVAYWKTIDDVSKIDLLFDHTEILSKALDRLRAKLTYAPIGFDLLPKEFLFSELEQLYVTILGRPIDRRNFRKKIMSFELLQETGRKVSEGKGRPAMTYTFNKKKYKELEEKGFVLQII
jgi:8-oxo-dGTP diphosphatase